MRRNIYRDKTTVILIFSFLLNIFHLNAQRHRTHAIIFPGDPPQEPPSSKLSSIFKDLKADEISTRFTASVGGKCVLPRGNEGSCLPLNDCPELDSLYQRGRRLTRRNFLLLRSRICRIFNSQRIFFCCPTPKLTVQPIRGAITGVGDTSSRSNLIPTQSECGISTGGRITEGTVIPPHSHPWLVNLGSPNGRQFKQICGGTLITKRHVLTASHCFIPRPGIRPISHARLGDHSLSKEESIPAITLRVSDRKSPGYNSRSQENDIELLTLEKDVTFNSNIRPLCLPFDLQVKDFDDDSMTIVGWGDTFHRSNEGSDVPMAASVPIISKQDCLRAYRRQTSVVIDDRQICAGMGGEDACQGDSGGPMIYRDPRFRHFFVGVVSFGVECGREDFPGVYTFIPSFLDWIQSNL